jgi:hypothetical protein
VAVKILPNSDVHSRNELKAFAALATSPLPCKHIVAAHPACLAPDGQSTYLPMQLCDEDLLSVVDSLGGMSEAEARAYFRGMRVIMIMLLAGRRIMG